MSEHRRGRIKRRGSVLDLVLIFLLLLSLFGIVMRWYWAKEQRENATEQAYRMAILVPALFSQVGDCIAVGESLYFESGEYCGRVVSLEKRPSEIELLSGGSYYTGEWDETLRCDLYLELEMIGSRIDRGLLWNGTKIFCVGQHVTLYSRYTALSGSIFWIEHADQSS